MSSRQVVIFLFYFILWMIVMLHITVPREPDYTLFDKQLEYLAGVELRQNLDLLKEFHKEEHMEGQRERVAPPLRKIDSVHVQSQETIVFLEAWKEKIAIAAGGYADASLTRLRKGEDLRSVTRLLIRERGGKDICLKINSLLGLFGSTISEFNREEVLRVLPLQRCLAKKAGRDCCTDWSAVMFKRENASAAITLLSAIQNNILFSEEMIISNIWADTRGCILTFDAIQTIAIPKQPYVFPGQKVHAEIFMAEYDAYINPTIKPEKGSIKKVEGGVGDWQGDAGSLGEHIVSGTASIKRDTQTVTRNWSFQYLVGVPYCALQLDKMNLFYRGVPNAVTISAGYPIEMLSLRIPGASIINRSPGHYEVSVNGSHTGDIMAYIDLKDSSGKVSTVGARKIQVRNLPPPIATIGGQTPGPMSVADFKRQTGISFMLPDSDFVVPYNILNYQFSMLQKEKDTLLGPFLITGPDFADIPEIKPMMAEAKPGDRIFITDIQAEGPGGRKILLAPLSLLLD